jgi:hypothetical protein
MNTYSLHYHIPKATKAVFGSFPIQTVVFAEILIISHIQSRGLQMWTLQQHITKLRRMYKTATMAKDDEAAGDGSNRVNVCSRS